MSLLSAGSREPRLTCLEVSRTIVAGSGRTSSAGRAEKVLSADQWRSYEPLIASTGCEYAAKNGLAAS